MDYKKAYYRLFNAITDSIDLLQKARQETEEQYLKEGDGDEDEEHRE